MRLVATMILFAIFIAACSPQTVVTENQTDTGSNTVETGKGDQTDDTGTVSAPIKQAASNTPTIHPTVTPTATSTPTSTPTPTPLPLLEGYVPEGAIKNLSRGAVYDTAVSPDGSKIVIASVGGFYILDGRSFEELQFIETEKKGYVVAAVEYSPDGNYILAVATLRDDFDQYLYLYQVSDYSIQKKVPFPRKYFRVVPQIAVSPAMPLVAFIVDAQRVYTWNYETKAFKSNIYITPSGKGIVNAIEFGPDGTLFVANNERVVSMTYGGKVLEKYEGLFDDRIGDVAISHDGRMAAAFQTGRLVIWEVETKNVLQEIRDEKIVYTDNFPLQILFSEDDSSVILSSKDALYSWSVQTGKLEHTYTLKLDGNAVLTPSMINLMKNEQLLVVSTDSILSVLNLTDGSVNILPEKYSPEIVRAMLSPGESYLAISLAAGWNGNSIRIIDPESGELINTTGSIQQPAYWLAFSNDEEYFAWFNGMGRIHSADDLKFICNSGNVTFSDDGKSFEYAYNRSHIIASLPGCSTRNTINLTGDKSEFAISPDFSMAAEALPDGSINISDVQTGKIRSSLTGFKADSYKLVFSPDSKYLAVASYQPVEKTWLWDLTTGEVVVKLSTSGPSFIENRLFTHSRNNVHVWDIDSRQSVATVFLRLNRTRTISNDGLLVADSQWNFQKGIFEINVTDIATNKVIYKYSGHAPGNAIIPELQMLFSIDSQRLFTFGPDGSILVWDVSH